MVGYRNLAGGGDGRAGELGWFMKGRPVYIGFKGGELGIQHAFLHILRSKALDVSARYHRLRGSVHTWAGDCREVNRSCCRVRSTEVCFWKFWRGFEGPHIASPMMAGVDGRDVVDVVYADAVDVVVV